MAGVQSEIEELDTLISNPSTFFIGEDLGRLASLGAV